METDTRQLEEENLYKALLDNGVDIVSMIDVNGTILYQSPTITDTLGYSPEELTGRCIFAYVHPEDMPLALKAVEAVMIGGKSERLILRVEDSLRQWCKIEVIGRRYEHQNKPCIILNIRDVRTNQAVLEKLRTSERLLHAAFNSTSSICSISNLETGEFIDVNDAWATTTGWSREEAIGRTAMELNIWDSIESRQRLTEQFSNTTKVRQFSSTYLVRSGEPRSLTIDAEIVVINNTKMMFLSGHDTTESQRVEAQLRQAQRLEAVGQLTGGIAHDLNNMLTVILGQIDLSLRKMDGAHGIRDALQIMRRATLRGSELIKQLMIFSRRQTLKPSMINIATTANNIRTLLEGSLGGEINIKMDLAEDTWDSYLDESLLESAILNLAINSRDAMPHGGELTLRTENTVIDAPTADIYEIEPGQYIRFSISDTGFGMDDLTARKVFEPFFTTKPMDQGSGLGLSMVFGFVKESGGHIEVMSAPDRGTTVEIVLPRAEGQKPQAIKDKADSTLLEGTRILVIEDSDELRKVITQLLKSLGCEVQTSDGKSLASVEAPLELILSDVMLPGQLQGPALVEQLLVQHPDARVIYMSGFPRERITETLGINQAILKKPFSREELKNRVTQALGYETSS